MTTPTLDDLKATIQVIFKQRVANLIKIGSKGAVMMCLQNAELDDDYRLTLYKSAIFDLDDADLKTRIKQIFTNGASKVYVLEYKTTFASVADVVRDTAWNWIFSIESGDQSDIALYCKESKRFGLVYNITTADSIWVASVNNPSAVLADGVTIDGDAEITGLDLLPIVAGVIAGCPYTQSISYKIFKELASVTQPTTYAYGQITLYEEEEGIRVASPVNTLLTTSDTYTEDMKSICIVEGMKRMEEDLIFAFRTSYKGRYKNDYDHQNLWLSAVDYYLTQLVEIGILDGSYNNDADIDVETQRALWKAQGKPADDWSEQQVKETTYKDMVYTLIDCKFLNAIEGLKVTVEMF